VHERRAFFWGREAGQTPTGRIRPDQRHSAIAAHNVLQKRVAQLNRRRARDSLPTTDVYVGLHIGEVFYDNIGSNERLDFTLVNPPVNEVARIAVNVPVGVTPRSALSGLQTLGTR
jgi:class 3 adenylate cyclase